MGNIQLVIFDCDGVLADSERVTNTVYAGILKEYGLNLTLDEMFENFVGNTMQHCLDKMTIMLGRRVPADFVDTYRSRCKIALEQELKPVRGVQQMLSKMKWPYCVASNSDSEKLRMILGYAKLLPIFEGKLFSSDQVAHGKPSPDIFLLAAREFDAQPAHTVVIEDTPIGVTAGVAAGMIVLGYAELMDSERLREAGAHRIFGNMSELIGLLEQIDQS
jgi:HAD superfamily hydrolase (TIGR01509 family)